MNNAIIFVIGIIACVGVWFASKKYGNQTYAIAAAAAPPVVPITQNGTEANSNKLKAANGAGGCIVGGAAAAYYGSPAAAPLGCAAGKYLADKSYDITVGAAKKGASTAKAVFHAVTPW